MVNYDLANNTEDYVHRYLVPEYFCFRPVEFIIFLSESEEQAERG